MLRKMFKYGIILIIVYGQKIKGALCMSEMKNTFKNYIDIILSSGVNESSESADDLSDFDDLSVM